MYLNFFEILSLPHVWSLFSRSTSSIRFSEFAQTHGKNALGCMENIWALKIRQTVRVWSNLFHEMNIIHRLHAFDSFSSMLTELGVKVWHALSPSNRFVFFFVTSQIQAIRRAEKTQLFVFPCHQLQMVATLTHCSSPPTQQSSSTRE